MLKDYNLRCIFKKIRKLLISLNKFLLFYCSFSFILEFNDFYNFSWYFSIKDVNDLRIFLFQCVMILNEVMMYVILCLTSSSCNFISISIKCFNWAKKSFFITGSWLKRRCLYKLLYFILRSLKNYGISVYLRCSSFEINSG